MAEDMLERYRIAARKLDLAWAEWLKTPDDLPSEDMLEAMNEIINLWEDPDG